MCFGVGMPLRERRHSAGGGLCALASKETANPRTWRLRPVMGSHWRHTRLQLEFTRSEGEGEFFHSQETVRRMLGAVFQTTCIHCEPRVQKRHATAALLYRAKQRLKVRWSRLRWSSAAGEASAFDDSEEDLDHHHRPGSKAEAALERATNRSRTRAR